VGDGWIIDSLTVGPPTDDLYDPAFSAWEWLRALAARGHQVRGIYPDPLTGPPPTPPDGVASFPLPLRAAERHDPIAYVHATRDATNPAAQLILRIPLGLGKVPNAKGRTARAPVAGLAGEVVLDAFDGRAADSTGFFARLGRWRNRRTLRKGESDAVADADLLVVPEAAMGDRLRQLYGMDRPKLAVVPDPVPEPQITESRAECRQQLKVAPDVELVAHVVGQGAHAADDLELALESFRRIRVFFPGARFAAIGSNTRTDPGVFTLPDRTRRSIDVAMRACDVVLLPRRDPGPDVAAYYALSHARATIATASVHVGTPEDGSIVRVPVSSDPGDIASDLAELLADPALRRTLGDAGHRFVAGRSYREAAERLEGLLTPVVAH
jgi:glycosyltransferase involved in cell wall biosynthesis